LKEYFDKLYKFWSDGEDNTASEMPDDSDVMPYKQDAVNCGMELKPYLDKKYKFETYVTPEDIETVKKTYAEEDREYVDKGLVSFMKHVAEESGHTLKEYLSLDHEEQSKLADEFSKYTIIDKYMPTAQLIHNMDAWA